MSSSPIAFYDSGIGGLPYLTWVRERLSGEQFVYVGDSEHFPYGEKSHEQLREIAESVVGRIIERFAPKLIVVACNTASVVALSHLRSRFSVPFVGVVPAVKPAAARSRDGKIGLLATTRTVGDAYSERLIEEYASGCSVVRVSGQELVAFVENELLDADPACVNAALEAAIKPLREKQVDSVILGCTHFTFLDRAIRELLGEGVEVIDSREGVGLQVIRVLEQRGLLARDEAMSPSTDVYHTGADGERYRRYAAHLGLGYGGRFT